MFEQKRGQSAASTAVTIAAIAGAMILYVLFLPPSERAELLNGDNYSYYEDNNYDNGVFYSGDYIVGRDGKRYYYVGDSRSNGTLLKTQPGKIELINQDLINHFLPTISLTASKSSVELLNLNSLSTSSSVFDSQDREITFDVDDLDNTDNLALRFQVNDKRGPLIIELNNQLIFDGTPDDSEEITIRKESLNNDNTLRFSSGSVGWKFWTTNSHKLNNVVITGDEYDYTGQTSQQTFSVTETEKFNTETSTLFFSPICNRNNVGKLVISLNNQIIHDSKPQCNSANNIDLSTSLLGVGVNRITFTSQQGDYLVDSVILQNRLKEQKFPNYFFDIDERYFEIVGTDGFERVGELKEQYKVFLTLEFVDDVRDDVQNYDRLEKRKQGDILVNDEWLTFDVRDDNVMFDITNHVNENNVVRIEPRENSLEIRELEIRMTARR